jgi:Core-2/I-Branching enzyme
MRVAYLVLAHANPRHFARLVRALETSSSSIFAHIDTKSDLQLFAQSSISNGLVRFCRNRVDVRWGEFSPVQASLNLLAEALQSYDKFEYFVLLSGTDYPLRSARYIDAFLEHHNGMQFLNLARLPCVELNKPMSRLTTYRFESSSLPGGLLVAKFGRLLGRWHLLPTITRDPGRHLGDLSPFCGSQWWALTRDACEHVLGFVRDRPRVMRFFRNVVDPDELVFHTILGNSPFRRRIHRGITYTDWSEGSSSPSIIDSKHVLQFEAVDEVRGSGPYGEGELLFARKFTDASEAVVRRIDRMIARKESRVDRRRLSPGSVG